MAKSKEEILKQISRAEQALANKGLSEGAKANISKQVEQLKKDLAAMEESVEKKEEKIEKKEAEAKQDFDAEIRKLEEQLKRNPPAKVKEIFERKLKEAKEKKAEIEKEAKEDKAEAKQELKEVKEAVKDLEKAVKKGGRTAPIKKPKIEEKKREEKSVKRVKDMKNTMSELEKLVNEVKELREKYKGKRVDLKRDAGRSAKPFGYRFVGPNDYRVPTPKQIEEGKKRGTIDYEARPNRSDKYPVGYKGDIREKLADGGMMGDGRKPKQFLHLGKKYDGFYVKISSFENPDLGGQILEDGFTTANEAYDFAIKMMYQFKFSIEQLIPSDDFIKEFKDPYSQQPMKPGMMAKGGMSEKPIPAIIDDYGNIKSEKKLQKDLEYLKEAYEDKLITKDEYNKQYNEIKEQIKFLQTKENGGMAKGGMSKKSYGFGKMADGGEIKAIRNKDADYFVNEDYEIDDRGKIKIYAIEIQDAESGDVIEYVSANSEKEANEMIQEINRTQMFARGGKPGMMAKGGMSKKSYGFGKMADGGNVDDLRDEVREYIMDMSKKEYRSFCYDYEIDYDDAMEMEEFIKNLNKEEANKILGKKNMAKGGSKMAKGGKTKKSKMRKNSPNRFCWTKEAVKDGIIKASEMDKCPSLYMRKKFPAYIKEK